MNKLKLLAGVPVALAVLIAAAPAATAAASLTVSPSTGLKNGQSVTVTGSGYPANLAVYVLECANLNGTSGAGCDISNLKQVTTSASGGFTVSLAVKTGTIGNGTCSAGGSCYISAGDAGHQAAASSVIKFASASTGSSSSSSSSSGSTAGSSSTPSTVNAGSGGGADRNGVPVGVIVLAALGAAAVIGGGIRFARR